MIELISIDNLKSIAKILQEAGKIEQYNQILDIQQKLLEMQARRANLAEENKDLKEKLKIKEKLVYESNCYWAENKGGKGGPFCSRCWDKDKALIRMHPMINEAYSKCPECRNDVLVSPDNSSRLIRRNRAYDIE